MYLCDWHRASPSPENSSEPAIPDGTRVAIKLIQPAKRYMRQFEEMDREYQLIVARELGPGMRGACATHGC